MTTNRSYKWVYFLALAGYLWLGWNMLEMQEMQSTVCLFKNVTGFACPSCGSSRALLAVFHGEFLQSILINPIGLLGALFLVVLPFIWLTGKLIKTDLVSSLAQQFEQRIRQPRAAFPLIALVLLNWVWNITKGL